MNAKIISVKIDATTPSLLAVMPKIHAFFDNGKNEILFQYYSDEMSFNEEEFIGLTKKEAMILMSKKDIMYIHD